MLGDHFLLSVDLQSILMLEGSQLRLLNNISLLSVYLSQSKEKWWEFSHGAPVTGSIW